MLQRLIPYTSALAVLAIGCNDSRTDVGAQLDAATDGTRSDAGSSDRGSDTTVLDDVSLVDTLDIDERPDVAPRDTSPSDVGAPDVVTRPDTGVDSSADAGSPTISEETREAVRRLCEQFESCGFGTVRECSRDIGDGLLDYAYGYAADFEECDEALGKFFVCLDEELQRECSEDVQYNCEREQRDIFYDCGLYQGY